MTTEIQRFANSRRVRLPAKVNRTMINKTVPWIESFWHAHKRFPSDSELLTQFNFGGVAAGAAGGKAELDLLQRLKLTKEFRAALKVRGIEGWNPLDSSGAQLDASALTPEQIATISVLANIADTRPMNVKLVALGVTPEQLNGWMSDPTFNRSLAARADETLGNIYPEAVNSLNRRVKQGNTTALKFYFELTGRAQTPEQINLRLAMQHLIESVQKHVKDPDVLQAIARDFQAVQQMGGDN